MKRGFRLNRPADFKRVRREGKSTAHPFLALIASPNENKGVRVAVAAGRTVGGAVQRNRAKRLLRAAILPLLEQVQPDHDILLLARPGIRQAKSPKVSEAIKGILRKAGLLKQ